MSLRARGQRAKRGELEDAQQQLAEAQAAVAELQASFEQDASSLAPWMCALFALADSGCRLFDAGGMAGPPAGGAPASSAPPLMDLLAPPSAATGGAAALSTWLFRDRERLLGAFQRRCVCSVGSRRWVWRCCGCAWPPRQHNALCRCLDPHACRRWHVLPRHTGMSWSAVLALVGRCVC
jgi:hypothetical protein